MIFQSVPYLMNYCVYPSRVFKDVDPKPLFRTTRPPTIKPKENVGLSPLNIWGKIARNKTIPDDLNSNQLCLQRRLLDLRNQMKELMNSNISASQDQASSSSENISDQDPPENDLIANIQPSDSTILKPLGTTGDVVATHQYSMDPPLSSVPSEDLIIFNDPAVLSTNQVTGRLNCSEMDCPPANSITAKSFHPVLSPICIIDKGSRGGAFTLVDAQTQIVPPLHYDHTIPKQNCFPPPLSTQTAPISSSQTCPDVLPSTSPELAPSVQPRPTNGCILHGYAENLDSTDYSE